MVEILRHRVCTCIHARTYLYKIGTCCLSLSTYMGRIAVLRAAPKHPMASLLLEKYDVDAEVAKADCENLLRGWSEIGIVE